MYLQLYIIIQDYYKQVIIIIVKMDFKKCYEQVEELCTVCVDFQSGLCEAKIIISKFL